MLEAHGNTLRVRFKEGVELHNGDGLIMVNGEGMNGEGTGCNVNGVNGNIVTVNKSLDLRYNVMSLYRNYDVEFTRSLHSERRIPVDIVFRETEDGFELSYKAFPSGRVWVGSFKFAHEPAKNPDKALDSIRTQLSKLGDTPYIARDVRVESKPYFIPISVLNQWRREVLI